MVSFGALVGMIIGGAVPMLWGDSNFLGAASILLGMIGGFAGIFAAVWLSKQLN
jgi:hypothetical protein